MADSDKDILITPNTGVATTHPKITFTGKDNSPVDLKILDDNTLSFEGVQGQVFSISPTLNSGDIFSVNDISGIQSMAINADGTISMNAQTKSVTITNSASNTSTLILENTNADAVDGPILDLYRNDSANSSDADDIGAIVWSANNDASEKTNFGRIMMKPNDVSNGTEDGEMIFKLTEAGSVEQEYMRLRGSARQVEINANQDDIDLVWNSDTENDIFYCNAGTSRVGIGTNAPAAKFHVDTQSTIAPSLTFGATAGQIFQNENSEFAFGLDNDSPYSLWIQGRNSGNAARDISLQPLGGKIGIGTESPASKLHVIGDANDEVVALFTTAGGTSSSVEGIAHIGLSHFSSDTAPSVSISAEEIDDGDHRADFRINTRTSASSNATPTEKLRVTYDGSIKSSLGNLNTCVSFVYNRSDMDSGAVNLKAVVNDVASSNNHWGFIMPKSGRIKYFTLNTRNHTVTSSNVQTWKINRNNQNGGTAGVDHFVIDVAKGATQDDTGVSGDATMELTESSHSSTIWRGAVVVNFSFNALDEIRIQRTNANSVDMGDVVGVIFVEFD